MFRSAAPDEPRAIRASVWISELSRASDFFGPDSDAPTSERRRTALTMPQLALGTPSPKPAASAWPSATHHMPRTMVGFSPLGPVLSRPSASLTDLSPWSGCSNLSTARSLRASAAWMSA